MIALSVIAITALFYCYISWRRLVVASELLTKNQADQDKKDAAGKQMKEALHKSAEALRFSTNEVGKLTAANEQLQGELARIEEESGSKQENFQRLQKRFEDRADHYESQLRTLTSQLVQLDREAAESRAARQTAESSANRGAENRYGGELKKLKEELKEVKRNHLIASTKLAERESQLTKVLPKFRANSQKVRSYNLLHKSLQGQKQLLEERNSNWEKALVHLSKWVLKDESKILATNSLGTLIGSALEKIKAGPLVNDEFSNITDAIAAKKTQEKVAPQAILSGNSN